MRLRVRTAILAATLVSLLAPAAAGAAEVRVAEAGFSGSGHWAYYLAAPGEANRLVVGFSLHQGETQVTFHDPGAVIEADTQCESLGPHTARCRPAAGQSISKASANLYDRDDRVRTTRTTPHPLAGLKVVGGAGADLLDGGAGADWLIGGGGRDTLLGGGSDDELNDGDTTGLPGEAGPGPDVMDGGPGEDVLSYEQRTRGVAVDLASRLPTGEPGEGDAARNFENVVGSVEPDLLAGTAERNELTGRAGRDLVLGRDGDDWLRGGAGRDRIEAGSGDDLVRPGGGLDRLSCGLGEDWLFSVVARELLGRCELITFDELFGGGEIASMTLPPHPVARSRRALRFRVPCPALVVQQGVHGRCSGKLTVRGTYGRRPLLGRARFAHRTSRESDVRVRLTKRARRLIRRGRGVIATVRVSGEGLPAVAWTIRLRRP